MRRYGVAAVLVIVVALIGLLLRSGVTGRTPRSARTVAGGAGGNPAETRHGERPAPSARGLGEPSESPFPETPWASVDLEALRKELPDNLYWKMSAPTKDPDVLREREVERERWNVEYGKVLSNTATADEIDAYYALRYRLFSDYVDFATFLLVDHGDYLPQQDVGLLKIAIELNMARLEEIPRQVAEAQQRREAHEAARRAWLESEKRFAGDDSR
jgi:hypothetical protein